MRRAPLFILFALPLLLPSCRARKLLQEASIRKDLNKTSTRQLLRDVAEDKYTPAADGRLTEAQIQMYLKVRDHEKEIAAVARKEMEQHARNAQANEKSLAGMMEGFHTMGSTADFLTADIRAAKDLHYNTQEYLWVKSQVLAASTAAMGRKMEQATSASFDNSYQEMKKQYDQITDPAAKKQLGEMLAGFDKQRQLVKPQPQDPSVEYNVQLLSRYENALNALTNAWAKYEGKEGEARTAMQQWEKSLDQPAITKK
jgi:hypothetical protein